MIRNFSICRFSLSLAFFMALQPLVGAAQEPAGVATQQNDGSRRPRDDNELRGWLENMVWYHAFSIPEIRNATGMTADEVRDALRRFDISEKTRPARDTDAPLLVLPYPGGRHPRIGFLDGAIRPQRETKVSVFTPWDPASYVVLDVPEAIWSNLGLTYLAHTHVPTVWTRQNVTLERLEWQHAPDGSLLSQRTLPNGIAFGTKVIPHRDHVQLEMWLANRSRQTLSDLRVQNCVLLKAAKGFSQQTNDNKVFSGPYVACRSEDGRRWIITAWDPLHRAWANAPCPCLHSDPKFPDCEVGETQRLRGWLSFYEGDDIEGELARIAQTGWRDRPFTQTVLEKVTVTGLIVDAATGDSIPARLHVHDDQGNWYFAESNDPSGSAVHYQKEPAHLPGSIEMHTTLSAHAFRMQLGPGTYSFRAERGKEYLPVQREITIVDEPADLNIPLHRWIDMSAHGWYSGDTHVHRSLEELPNVLLAEDLNVALPLTYWVREAGKAPSDANQDQPATSQLIQVDESHVIHPTNTEYELFTVNGRPHTLGAVFVLNHQSPLELPAPPVRPIAQEARRQGALLDLDKHSWPWSLMLVPVMDVDLFELSNNHLWQTRFGFKKWTLPTMPSYMRLETDDEGFTEWGWTDFGFQNYYALLNCGFPMRVTAGTASGVHPVQLGFGRVYVHLPDGFSYDAWIKGLNAGHSFVTTGPMLQVTFNGHGPGHHIEAPEDGQPFSVAIDGVASSRRPLDRIEIIAAGEVVQSISPANRSAEHGGFESPIQTSLPLDASSWVAVRCFERHPRRRIRFAHTNPIHFQLAGKPLRPRKEEVSYLVGRMQEELNRNQNVLDAKSLSEYEDALNVYEEILKTAR